MLAPPPRGEDNLTAGVTPTHYFQTLPVDVVGIVVDYVLYDWSQSCTQRAALFAEPIFGQLTQSSAWRTFIAQHPYFVYRAQWSTIDGAVAEGSFSRGAVRSTIAVCSATPFGD